ncbi:MAG: DUF1704 domain-containing protein [Polyangiales bacterium]
MGRAMRSVESLRAMLKSVDDAVRGDRRVKVLAALAWPREVEERFFAKGCDEVPKVTYAVDREALEARAKALDAVADGIDGDDPVAEWLRSVVGSYRDANLMLAAVGTRGFHARSTALYGSASSRFHGGITNAELAEHILDRVKVHGWDSDLGPAPERLDAEALAAALKARVAEEHPGMKLDVVIDDDLAAKVVAGRTRVRVRRGATFAPDEAAGLYHHEVETHALSAQNGAAQAEATFLRGGGPRSTRAQEGLAVYAELHHNALSVERLERLARRVKLVAMAESGADFVELFRYLTGLGEAPRDAWLDAQRVCRGGLATGGAPYTKDAAYLAGLLDVQAFLSAVTRGGFRDEMELLVCGRIALDDLHALVVLQQAGLIARPRFVPSWLRRWETLLARFAFVSFVADVDLAPTRERYAALVATASRAKGP